MALGIALFFEPKNIVPGGLTGVAMMLNSLFPVLPVGMTVMVLNVPLFIVGWRRLGGMFVAYSLTGTASLSLFIDVFARLPVPECQPLAAVMLGGALVGAGIGLVFSRGGSTGGSDLMARLLKAVFPSARMGALMLSVDGAVVFASMFVFGGGELYAALDLAFYAIAGLFVSSQLADLILYGTNVQWTAHIISDDWTAVSAALQNELGRGVTLLKGEGGYSGAAREVILCAVGRSQLATMKAVVKETDPHAFIIVNKAYEVLGEGFRAYDKNSI
ncbi:MAG: YitT family protein [Oscillospiraceae bacterium]|nr:YitT family protein [Oscillospiraceae bacterium]